MHVVVSLIILYLLLDEKESISLCTVLLLSLLLQQWILLKLWYMGQYQLKKTHKYIRRKTTKMWFDQNWCKKRCYCTHTHYTSMAKVLLFLRVKSNRVFILRNFVDNFAPSLFISGGTFDVDAQMPIEEHLLEEKIL